MLSNLQVLVRIALANIFSSALNVFVGLVLLFGAALLVIGGSLFTTLDDSLSRSIVDSITGHLQVYAARSKDPLEIYGKVDGSDVNLAPIDDFKDAQGEAADAAERREGGAHGRGHRARRLGQHRRRHAREAAQPVPGAG
jgi:ABC-type lipoprotein release transport system permease subunit